MLQGKISEFHRFLQDSFRDDTYSRELRLSPDELEYVKKVYPRAEIREMDSWVYEDGKRWYQIHLLSNRRKT